MGTRAGPWLLYAVRQFGMFRSCRHAALGVAMRDDWRLPSPGASPHRRPHRCVSVLIKRKYFTGFTGKPGAGESRKPSPPTWSVKSNAQKHSRAG
eukprot:2122550-Prymnesium_polylepis.1